MNRNKLLLGSLGVLLCAAAIIKLRKKRVKRRFRIRPINQNRRFESQYVHFKKMKESDDDEFFKHTRMTPELFDHLLDLIKNKIIKRRLKDGISPEERLAITLQYLSQGGSMQSIAWAFQIGLTTVHKIIHETCCAIWECLSNKYICPSTEEEWKDISKGYSSVCNYPNCIGAVDGKYIEIQCHAKSENHKKEIVLMAACDSNYQFTLVDIGIDECLGDGSTFKNFRNKLEQASINVPCVELIPNSNVVYPYTFVASGAFPLKEYIMRPFGGKNVTVEQKIFNYRLSRVQRIIENAFGILVARWQILNTAITAKVDNIDNILKACIILHNFCKVNFSKKCSLSTYCPPGFVDSNDENNGNWRREVNKPLQSVGRLSANNSTRDVYRIRNKLTEYFLLQGQEDEQDQKVGLE